MPKQHILVVASTFPATSSEPVPAFVKDQIIAMKSILPSLKFTVLAPHNQVSITSGTRKHAGYTESRFHYFFPHRFEVLTDRGILPALKQNKLTYMLVPFFFISELFSLWRLTKRIKPDILYAHWFTPQAINSALVSRLTGIPFVFTTHASDVSVLRKLPFSKRLVRWVCSYATAYTAVSDRTAAKLHSMFSEADWKMNFKKKLSIIPMGTSMDISAVKKKDVSAIKKLYGVPHNKQYILYLGRLTEKKGVGYLLEAFSILPRNIAQNLHLIVAGDGQLRNKLEKQAANLQLKNVTFTGYVYGKEKDGLFSLADFVCLPSIIDSSGDSEGLPVVLMEGLATDKIVLASDKTGAENIIAHGKSGFIFTQKSAGDLAECISRAAKLDSKAKRNMQRQSKDLAMQFNWAYIAKRHFQELFEPVL